MNFPIFLFIYLFIYLLIYLSIYLFICLLIYLFIYLFIYSFVCLFVCLFIYLSFFKLGFTACKAEQSVRGTELQEKEVQKKLFRKNLQLKDIC